MSYVLFNDVRRCNGDNTQELRQTILQRYVHTPVTFSAPPPAQK
jgi:hypothetical protein